MIYNHSLSTIQSPKIVSCIVFNCLDFKVILMYVQYWYWYWYVVLIRREVAIFGNTRREKVLGRLLHALLIE